jgi:hypothetical protein
VHSYIDFFLQQIDKYGGASDFTLQKPRYLCEGVFLAFRVCPILRRCELGDDDPGKAAKFGIPGDELGLMSASGGIEDRVGQRKPMVKTRVGSGEGRHFVERNHSAVQRLREKSIRKLFTSVARELAVDLIDDE